MEKKSWIDTITHKLLRGVDKLRTILSMTPKWKGNWIGHILQKECLLHNVVESKIE